MTLRGVASTAVLTVTWLLLVALGAVVLVGLFT